MTRFTCLASLAAVLLTTGIASAQIQNRTPGATPTTRPTVSPYVTLGMRRSPAVNYFGIVRPQRDFRASLRQLQDRVSLDEAQTEAAAEPAGGVAPSVPATGHITTFQNFSHFYPSAGVGPYGGATSIRARRQ
uniref:Uncharacterized protein n=1 Tax=Schlesneria paludicola TaxID=360056 RepID=A0A7C2P1V2_9PLAN